MRRRISSPRVTDSALFRQENEFFIFDSVTVSSSMSGCSYEVDFYEGAWNAGKTYEEGNKRIAPLAQPFEALTIHQPALHGWRLPVRGTL